MVPSRHDWKIVDRDVKPQHNQSPGLYSVLYTTSECKALYSTFQVYIQNYIQQPNVELYIRLSNSFFSTIFKLWM